MFRIAGLDSNNKCTLAGSLDQLENQMEVYYQTFDHVCVVALESFFSRLYTLFLDSPVGICGLTKRNTIRAKQKKEPVSDARSISHQSVFKLLRKREYERIIHSYHGFLPEATPVFLYEACEALFSGVRTKSWTFL